MTPDWRFRSPDPAAVRALSRDLPEVLAGFLVARGHGDPERIERHLRASPMDLHDPGLLPGMAAGTERIGRALRDGETILVHGDYDVDGVTGTALLIRCLRLLGARSVWHIPNRFRDGYSFGQHSIDKACETGASVVISVDNGTSAHDIIGQLSERGVDTVVTDHHEAPPGPLPDATAIVNPKLPTSTYPWRELCGGAVAFKLAWGLAQTVSGGRKVTTELKAFLEEATALVAIATVCDVVPLLDENRVFARFGLQALERTKSPGLRALVEAAGIGGRRLGADEVAFQIGPRINASGRLGSAEHAVELLLSDDVQEARRLAARLDELNVERKEIEADVLVEARAQAADFADAEAHPVLVLAGQGWHQGVVGIVAARMVEQFARPAIVIGLDGDTGRGSARTVDGFNVLDAISGAAEHLTRYGGHEQAAGLEIRAEAVDATRAAICARARALLVERPYPAPELLIDCELPFASMDPALMRQLDRLEPFGQKNEEPVFLSRDLRLAEPPREVGADGTHLMLRLRRGDHVLKAMAFSGAHRSGELRMGAPVDAVYTPHWNTFRGQTNLELVLHDFRCPG